MSECAVHAVLGTVALAVGLVNAGGRLVVAQVVALLGVARVPVHIRTFVGIGTDARLLVILVAVGVRVVVEGGVAFSERTPPTLILKVPVEACVRPVLSALVLQEERTLLDAESFQIP